MKTILKGAAKRLTFSLVIAVCLGGCAVYQPGYPGYGGYPGYSTYDPYYGYGAPVYSGVPYYVGPPVSFDFLWFEGRGGGYGRGYGHGHHGGFHGGHRGPGGGRHR
jgi:uncharacterized membrane protein YgcG